MTKQIAVALIALAVLIGATVAADAVVQAPQRPTQEFTEDVSVDSGTWYCAPIVRENETATLSIAAVGDEPSRVRIERIAGGESSAEDPLELAPETTEDIEIEGSSGIAGFLVRWSGGPAVASWRVDGGQQRVTTPCASSPAPRWSVPGAETTIGSSTRLYLFNPFDSDAVARVAFATPEGRIDLVSSENVSVPAREVVDLGINELQPEQPDMGILVEVEAGRVIATAMQRFGQPDLPDVELEGAESPLDPTAPEGRTVLPAIAETSTSVGLAYASAGESSTSWASVVNPTTEPANVAVEVTDAIAGTAIEQELVIGPESVERVELSGVSSAPQFGVRLTSTNGVPIAANGFVALIGDDKRVSSATAVAEADVANVLPVVPPDTDATIMLYNAGDAGVTANVSVGGEVPSAWSAVELAAGTVEVLSFEDAGVSEGGPVVASADQPIYATMRLATAGSEVDQFATSPLLPANLWQGSANAPVPVRERTLDTRPVDFPAPPEQ
jgi:hypothetical protein